jgi:hypothetical protein
VSGGPLIDGLRISPDEAYSGIRPSIDYIRAWGSVCYTFVSPKSMPTRTTSRKYIDPGSEGVFVGYYSKTDKQFTVYCLDLRYVIFLLVVNVDKTKQGGSIDLKLRGENA